ncbi:MAG: cobalamin-independent methionine synthase II family protein [Acidimicrobiia bacterium]|nr:cobalamin-independent methionine synthase II family protein [Acidimicrobiia bacterium]
MTSVGDLPLLPTTVIGSHPQPRWLVDHDRLRGVGVPRVRAREVWRIDPEAEPAAYDEAIEAATLLAIADQTDAGVDIITDGEIGRESYFNHFANSLGGVDKIRTGKGVNRRGGVADVPLVNGPIERLEPIELDAARYLRAHTDRLTKVTVPGPFTLSQLAQNDHYPDQHALAMAYAAAVNAELKDLAAAGIDVLQVDEPYLQANTEAARGFAVEAIAAAVDGVDAVTTLHTCYGYAVYVENKSSGYPFLSELARLPVDYIAIEAAQPGLPAEVVTELAPRKVVIGVLDLGSPEVERPEAIAARIRELLRHIDIADLSISPDCGMKYVPRPVAKAKLAAMVAAADIIRSEHPRNSQPR